MKTVQDTSDAKRVIDNINSTGRAAAFCPLGGSSPATGSHKGYGLRADRRNPLLDSSRAALTSNHVTAQNGLGDTSQSFFCAIDYGMFGDKARDARERCSTLLEELRDSAKAAKAAPAFTTSRRNGGRLAAMKSSKTASPSTTPRSRSFAPSAASSDSILTPW